MLKKIIRKIIWKKKYLQLRGAKILKDKKDPFFVSNIISSLSEVSLDINPKKFPKILVGSHGKGFFDRLILGSVTNSIIQQSHCPVLVVK